MESYSYPFPHNDKVGERNLPIRSEIITVMARITVEDCLREENNRFALVQLAAKRTKQLLNGAKLLIDESRGNKSVVNSLREIAAGQVRMKTEEDIQRERELALQKREAELALAAEQAEAEMHDSALTNGGSVTIVQAPPAASDSGSDDSEEESAEGEEALQAHSSGPAEVIVEEPVVAEEEKPQESEEN